MEPLTTAALANLIAGTLLLAAVGGLGFTALQIRRSSATQRGMFFKHLYEPFFLDREIQYLFRLIEHREDIFRPGFGSDPWEDEEEDEEDEDEQKKKKTRKRQRAIERVFAHFEIICSLYQRKLLAYKDMRHFNYNIQRLFNYPGFHDYEAMLDSWWRDQGLERGPYSSFFWYTKKNSERLTTSTPIRLRRTPEETEGR